MHSVPEKRRYSEACLRPWFCSWEEVMVRPVRICGRCTDLCPVSSPCAATASPLKWGCLCSCRSPTHESLTLYFSDSVAQSMKTTVKLHIQYRQTSKQPVFTTCWSTYVRKKHLEDTSLFYCLICIKWPSGPKHIGQSHTNIVPHRPRSSCTFSSCIMRFK